MDSKQHGSLFFPSCITDEKISSFKWRVCAPKCWLTGTGHCSQNSTCYSWSSPTYPLEGPAHKLCPGRSCNWSQSHDYSFAGRLAPSLFYSDSPVVVVQGNDSHILQFTFNYHSPSWWTGVVCLRMNELGILDFGDLCGDSH